MEDEAIVDTQTTSPAEAVKTLSQEEVNALVGREKKAAADKAKREADAYYQGELAKVQGSTGNTPNVDDIYRQVEERLLKKQQDEAAEAAKQERDAEMNEVVRSYTEKMSKGSEFFDDFDDVMGDFNAGAFPHVVYLVNEMENTPAIMHELVKNPSKLAQIHTLAIADPQQARRALKQLSDSIAVNQQARETHIPTEPPLSRPKPSQVGADNALNSIKDYKNQSWLKT
ncbi:MAG: hypothetical protein ABIP54_02170 [Candidatus Andersenbacteria bacterium]